MVLNYLWIAFFLIAFVVALIKLLVVGDTTVFPSIVNAIFGAARNGFEISLFLTGILAFWMGIMRIGEKGGIVKVLSVVVGPLFRRLFPAIPRDHPVMTPIVMNFSANLLGLDNAATPMGLKAMEGLQELNPNKKKASDAQIMFLVLNTSGLTLIPINIMVYRAEAGAADPADIFLPILLATACSTLVGLIAVGLRQRLNFFDPVIIGYLVSIAAVLGGGMWYLQTLDQDTMQVVSANIAHVTLFSIIIGFILLGWKKRINVYESFVSGAKEGFQIAVKIIPYLVAILTAIAAFRASGTLELINQSIASMIADFGGDTRFIPSLPVAFMKPLSGSGARGMMLDIMEAEGVDSFAGRLASVMQGSTETTFYVLALYFGSVNIKNSRYAVTYGLLADFAGIIASVAIAYFFFG
ncbi:nucleoside recognition domain-containing protein [Roseivirga sp. BDSF3-8]|uniref:nucleoside recognition domain-containing protein n=1 Tax=Roseivirga sp. BDSF3-8 TaxID=3241598 RepID=UPI0035324736